MTSLAFAYDRKKPLIIEPMAFKDCTAESLYLPGSVKVDDYNFQNVKSISLDIFSNLPDILSTCIVGFVDGLGTVNGDVHTKLTSDRVILGGVLQVNVGKQSYFFPRTMLLSDRMRLLNDIAKVCFSPVLSLSKKTQKRMLKKIVNKAYQLSAFDAGCRVAVKTYGNMSQKERATKDGKNWLHTCMKRMPPFWR